MDPRHGGRSVLASPDCSICRPDPHNQSRLPNGEYRQRRQLDDSEKKAAAQQPENYKDEETADKVVEIGPDKTDEPIKGIDSDEKKQPPQRE